MKLSDVKVGQVLGATFPYSDHPERKYGYRVIAVVPEEAGGFVHTQDVKTGGLDWYVFNRDGNYKLDATYSNWHVVEEAP